MKGIPDTPFSITLFLPHFTLTFIMTFLFTKTSRRSLLCRCDLPLGRHPGSIQLLPGHRYRKPDARVGAERRGHLRARVRHPAVRVLHGLAPRG